jgi:hypothetical protein
MRNDHGTTTNLTLGGTVSGLQADVAVFEIAQGASVNGAGRGVIPSGVALSRATGTVVPSLCDGGTVVVIEDPVLPDPIDEPVNPVVPGVTHYVGFTALSAAPLDVRPGEWVTIYLRPTVEEE